MSSLAKSSILLLCLLCLFGRSTPLAIEPVPCADESAATAPDLPLPTFPDQFSMNIESNILQKNLTINIRDTYDYTGNRVAIERYDRDTGVLFKTILDYNTQLSKAIFPNGTCNVKPLNSSGLYSFFGESSHIHTARDFMHFSNDTMEEYMGETMVRGIAVNHWRACATNDEMNGTFQLNYYFTKETYSTDGQHRAVPVRLHLVGSGKSFNRTSHSMSDELHSFDHIYEYTDFKWGLPNDLTVFEVPIGTLCMEDAIPSRKLPLLPDQFSMGLERVKITDMNESKLIKAQVYADFTSLVFREDLSEPLHDNETLVFGAVPIIKVYESSPDDSSGLPSSLTYVLDEHEKNCTVTKEKNLTETTESFWLIVPSLLKYFHIYGGSGMIYQGEKTWRGTIAHAWGTFPNDNEIFEVFYRLRKNEDGKSDGQLLYDPVGVYYALDTQGVHAKYIENIFNFKPGLPNVGVFDVSVCYSPGHRYTTYYVEVRSTRPDLDEDATWLYLHRSEFTAAFHGAMAKYIGVSGTRVSSVTIEPFEKKRGRFIVSFRLLAGAPKDVDDQNLDKSKLEKRIGSAITRMDVVTINVRVKSSGLVSNQTDRVYRADMETLWEAAPNDDKRPTSTITSYSPAAMAGLGVGMLVLGALLGLLGAFIIYKKIDSSVPYEVQMNERTG